jgi:hypothetical protein
MREDDHMKNETYTQLKGLFCLILVIMMFAFSNAFAWRGGHGGGGFHGHYSGGYHGWGWYGYPAIVVNDPYNYYYGFSYPYSEGYISVASSAPAAVAAQPSTQSAATTQTKPLSDTITQLKSPSSASVASQESIGDTVTIFVPNSAGRFTPVRLIKHNNGYSGPQGEFYPDHPTVAQLRALYGY